MHCHPGLLAGPSPLAGSHRRVFCRTLPRSEAIGSALGRAMPVVGLTFGWPSQAHSSSRDGKSCSISRNGEGLRSAAGPPAVRRSRCRAPASRSSTTLPPQFLVQEEVIGARRQLDQAVGHCWVLVRGTLAFDPLIGLGEGRRTIRRHDQGRALLGPGHEGQPLRATSSLLWLYQERHSGPRERLVAASMEDPLELHCRSGSAAGCLPANKAPRPRQMQRGRDAHIKHERPGSFRHSLSLRPA